jgi:hypothetical protein
VKDVLFAISLVRDPDVVTLATDDTHLIGREPCLHPEGASGPALTGKAVAYGDRERVALGCQTELTTTTSGVSGSHRAET